MLYSLDLPLWWLQAAGPASDVSLNNDYWSDDWPKFSGRIFLVKDCWSKIASRKPAARSKNGPAGHVSGA